MISYDINERWKNKNHSTDRILVLKTKEGQKARNSQGIVDPRLFTRENNLHVKRNHNYHWYFEYDAGRLPPQLDQRFTTFERAKAFAITYFDKRNVDVIDVIDNYEIH